MCGNCGENHFPAGSDGKIAVIAMKRISAIAALLLLTLAVFADPVDDLTLQLDRLEGRFWVALTKGPNDTDYREVENMVRTLASDAGRLQQQLRRWNLQVSCNLSTESRRLENLFASTRRSMAECYRTRFDSTRLDEYQDYARREGLYKRGEAAPTLATLDITHYRTWLEDLQIENREALRRVSGEKSSRQDAEMRDRVDTFLQSYVKLRVALAEIRQEAARRNLKLELKP